MSQRLPRFVRLGLFAGMILLCVAAIARSLAAPPVTEPLAQDHAKAERKAASRVGGDDVRGAMPDEGDNGARVGGNGIVEPAERETRVAAQVTAIVEKLLVREGDRVKAGAVLVQLADAVERAAWRSAEADLAGERASLARALRGVRIEDREAAAAEVQAARSRAELSAGTAARVELLAKQGASTQEDLDRARKNAQTDAATLRVSEARLKAAEKGSREEDITFARARVTAAEARLAQAKATVERLAIRAPIDGEVLQIKIRAGELYSFQQGDPLLIMGDTSRLRVRMDVDERDVARVQLGATAYVLADAYGARRFGGKVVEIGRRFGRKNIRTDDPTEKNDTKILEVLIQLDPTDALIPGQRVTSYIATAPTKSRPPPPSP